MDWLRYGNDVERNQLLAFNIGLRLAEQENRRRQLQQQQEEQQIKNERKNFDRYEFAISEGYDDFNEYLDNFRINISNSHTESGFVVFDGFCVNRGGEDENIVARRKWAICDEFFDGLGMRIPYGRCTEFQQKIIDVALSPLPKNPPPRNSCWIIGVTYVKSNRDYWVDIDTENDTDFFGSLYIPKNKTSHRNSPATNRNNNSQKTLEMSLAALNSLVGLNRVKQEVSTLINTVRINKMREKNGLKKTPMSLHLVFSGNPGTGKTTVARILGDVYRNLGVLPKGHLIETDRSGLVAEYVGQTAVKTQAVIQRAMGGILFIDEAYSLTPQKRGNDFGQEAVDTLLKAMEDYRDNFIVVVAGYPDLMKNFLKSNPGLQSRFNTFINFENYAPTELLNIFLLFCKQNDYVISRDAANALLKIFESIHARADDSFANGRTVRNIFEKTIQNQANRLAKNNNLTGESMRVLTLADIVERK